MSKPRFAAFVGFAFALTSAVGCNRGGGGGDPQVVPIPDARSPDASGPSTPSQPDAGALEVPEASTTPPVALREPEQHRAQAQECDRTPPPPGNPDPKAMGCKSDKECTGGKNGRCRFHAGGHEAPHNECEVSGCFTDDDCKALGSNVCSCGGRRGLRSMCMAGNCRIDADCRGAGQRGYCSPSTGGEPMGACGGASAYYCRTAKDTCAEDADCKDSNKSCAFQPLLGYWTCLANRLCPVG